MFSTRQAANELGIDRVTLQRYIAFGKIRPPAVQNICGVRIRLWSRREVERLRKNLPNIKDGRRKAKR